MSDAKVPPPAQSQQPQSLQTIVHGPMMSRSGSVRSVDFKDIYSNASRIGMSQSDFGITFSKIIEPTAGIAVVEDQAIVRMSANQFKIFVDHAVKTLAAWEDTFGDIKVLGKLQDVEAIKERMRKLKQAIDNS
jgi:hypothetical protein